MKCLLLYLFFPRATHEGAGASEQQSRDALMPEEVTKALRVQ